jgi:hypothetical protein
MALTFSRRTTSANSASSPADGCACAELEGVAAPTTVMP